MLCHNEADAASARALADFADGRVRFGCAMDSGIGRARSTAPPQFPPNPTPTGLVNIDVDKAAYVYAREHKSIPRALTSGVLGEHLACLDLTASGIVDENLKVVAPCVNLAQLYLSNNNLTSLKTLPKLPHLLTLCASFNSLGPDFTGFPELPSLAACLIGHNDIANWTGVPNMPFLHSLDLRGNPITNHDYASLRIMSCLLFGRSLATMDAEPVIEGVHDSASRLPPYLAEIVRTGGYLDWQSVTSDPTRAKDECAKERIRRYGPGVVGAIGGLIRNTVQFARLPMITTEDPVTERNLATPRVGALLKLEVSFTGSAAVQFDVVWYHYTASGGLELLRGPERHSLKGGEPPSYATSLEDEGLLIYATVDPLDESGDRLLNQPLLVTSDELVAASTRAPAIRRIHLLSLDQHGNASRAEGGFVEGSEIHAHAEMLWNGIEGGDIEFQWERHNSETGTIEDVTPQSMTAQGAGQQPLLDVETYEGTCLHDAASTYEVALADVGHRIICRVSLSREKSDVKTIDCGIIRAAEPIVVSMELSRFRGTAHINLEEGTGRKSAPLEGDELVACVVYCGGYRGKCEFTWERSNKESSAWFTIAESEGSMRYTLTADDVGHIHRFKFIPVREDGERGSPCYSESLCGGQACKARPPSVRTSTVIDPKCPSEGKTAEVYADYDGGYEGSSYARVAYANLPPPDDSSGTSQDSFQTWFDSLQFHDEMYSGPPLEGSAILWKDSGTENDDEMRTLRCRVPVDIRGVGKHLVVVHTPCRSDGVEGNSIVVASKDVIEPAKPEVFEVSVSCSASEDSSMSPGLKRFLQGVHEQGGDGSDMLEGNVLTLKYKYYGGFEGDPRITWLRRSAEGGYSETAHVSSTSIVAEQCSSYVLTADDCGSTMQVEIIPTRSDGEIGDAVRVDVMNGRLVQGGEPRASNVFTQGELLEGCILRAHWQYRGGHQGRTICKWNRRKLIVDEHGATLEQDFGSIPEIDDHSIRLGELEVGCRVVLTLQPYRDDGAEGDRIEHNVRSFDHVMNSPVRHDAVDSSLYVRPLVPVAKIEVEYWNGSAWIPADRISCLKQDSTLRIVSNAAVHSEDYSASAYALSEWMRVVDGNLEKIDSSTDELYLDERCVGITFGASAVPWRQINGSRFEGERLLLLPHDEDGKLLWLPYNHGMTIGKLPEVAAANPVGNSLKLPLNPVEGNPYEPIELSYHGGCEGNHAFCWYAVDASLAKNEADGNAIALVEKGDLSVYVVGRSRSLVPCVACVSKILVLAWVPVRIDGAQGDVIYAQSPTPCAPREPFILWGFIERAHPLENTLIAVDGHAGGIPGVVSFQWFRLEPGFKAETDSIEWTDDARLVAESPLVGLLHIAATLFQSCAGKPYMALAPLTALEHALQRDEAELLSRIGKALHDMTNVDPADVSRRVAAKFRVKVGSTDGCEYVSFERFATLLASVVREVGGVSLESIVALNRTKHCLLAVPDSRIIPNAHLISGATDSSYTVSAEDLGYKIGCVMVTHRSDGEAGKPVLCIFDDVIGTTKRVLKGLYIDGNPVSCQTISCRVNELADDAADNGGEEGITFPAHLAFEWSIADAEGVPAAQRQVVSVLRKDASSFVLDESHIGKYVYATARVVDLKGSPLDGEGSTVTTSTGRIKMKPPRSTSMRITSRSAQSHGGMTRLGMQERVKEQIVEPDHLSTLCAEWNYEGGVEGESSCRWYERQEPTVAALRIALANAGAPLETVNSAMIKASTYIATAATGLIAFEMAPTATKGIQQIVTELTEYSKERANGRSPDAAALAPFDDAGVTISRFSSAVSCVSDSESLESEAAAAEIDEIAQLVATIVNEDGPRNVALQSMVSHMIETTTAVLDWRRDEPNLLYESSIYPCWVESIGKQVVCVHRSRRADGTKSHQVLSTSTAAVKVNEAVDQDVNEFQHRALHKVECSLPSRRGERFLFTFGAESCKRDCTESLPKLGTAKLSRFGHGMLGIGGRLTEAKTDFGEGFSASPNRRVNVMMNVTMLSRQGDVKTYALDLGSVHRRDVTLLLCRRLAERRKKSSKPKPRLSRSFTQSLDASRERIAMQGPSS